MQHCIGSPYGAHSVHRGHSLHLSDIRHHRRGVYGISEGCGTIVKMCDLWTQGSGPPRRIIIQKIDDKYNVERTIKNLQTIQLLELRLVLLIKTQLRHHMRSYEEKDLIRCLFQSAIPTDFPDSLFFYKWLFINVSSLVLGKWAQKLIGSKLSRDLILHISPFSLYRLMLDHPPLNTVWKGKVMLVYWERTIVPDS